MTWNLSYGVEWLDDPFGYEPWSPPSSSGNAEPRPESAVEINGPVPPGWPHGVVTGTYHDDPPPPEWQNGTAGNACTDVGPNINRGPLSATGTVGVAAYPDGSLKVLAWADPENGYRLTVSFCDPDVGAGYWQSPIATEETSSNGVTVSLDPLNRGVAYLAWTGTDDAGTINTGAIAYGDQGIDWKTTYWGQEAEGTPAVAVSDDFTFLAWTGTDGNHTLNLARLNGRPPTGGMPTAGYVQVICDGGDGRPSEQCSGEPRVVFLDHGIVGNVAEDSVCVSWLGTDGEANVLVVGAVDGGGLKYVTPISGGGGCVPAVTAAGLWYLAFSDPSDTLWVTASQTGPSNWLPAVDLIGTPAPSVGPTATWDLAGDGLMLGYLEPPPDGGPNGTPCIAEVSLDPDDWRR